ncbi:MAG TPA: ATP synthase F0 subunit B [Terriglobia bacterium]|nr:ATP synthase F0 subunit B [Terriglobia bacterium]
MSHPLRRALLLLLLCASFCVSLLVLSVQGRANSSVAPSKPTSSGLSIKSGQAPSVISRGMGVPRLAAIFLAPPEDEAEASNAESKELIYKTINFIILVGGLAFLLRKPLAEFFAQRSADIKGSLEEGRKALEASQARLTAIEEKLKHLEEEIAAFKISAAREMGADRLRVQQAAAAEAEKILESARSRMETTTRAAKLELRYYIAGEALKQAEQMIRGRLDDTMRSRLVSQFVTRLDVKQNMN